MSLRMLSSTGCNTLCVYLERYGMLVRVLLGRGRNSDTEKRQSGAKIMWQCDDRMAWHPDRSLSSHHSSRTCT